MSEDPFGIPIRNKIRRSRVDPQDLIGKTKGLLSIEGLSTKVEKNSRGKTIYHYDCLCSCGNKVCVSRPNLITPDHTRSCGCLKNRRGPANPGWQGAGKLSGYFWACIRHHAKRKSRTLPFTIIKEDAWKKFQEQRGRCALTGWELSIEHSSSKASTRTASLDRVDNTKGYILGNIQWVHKDVNKMKWNLTNARFIEVCRTVVKFRKG